MLGLARSGLASVEALVASGARGDGLGQPRGGARRRCAGKARRSPIRSRSISPASTASSSRPGVPLNRHPIAARARAAGVPLIGDIELFAQARADAAAAQGGRHHRHQRQVDHHRAGPPHPQDRRRAGGDGRQYRPADPRPGPAAGRRRLCAGTVELPDRPDLQPRLRRRGPAQHHAGPSRPLRRFRRLCGLQGAAVRDAVGDMPR